MQLTTKSGRQITLRQPQPDDAQLLFNYNHTLEIEDTFTLLNPSFPVTLQEETDYLSAILKRLRAKWQVMYLAFDHGLMIGSGQVTVQGRRRMHVGNFGISLLKTYRHDGLGEQLSRLIIAEAKEVLHVTLITLDVFANNETALNLYRKLGFIDYGRLPNGLKYKDHFIDSILMYKPLV